jgi:hypothetical protein
MLEMLRNPLGKLQRTLTAKSHLKSSVGRSSELSGRQQSQLGERSELKPKDMAGGNVGLEAGLSCRFDLRYH